MLRLTDIKLPLDHGPDALKTAILKKLKLPADDLLDWRIFKRAHDARNKHAIHYVHMNPVSFAAIQHFNIALQVGKVGA